LQSQLFVGTNDTHRFYGGPQKRRYSERCHRFRERLEDVEDLIELRSAIERNAGKPGVPWEKVKAELDLD